MKTNLDLFTEINKIKFVLVALWKDKPNAQAQEIIGEFEEELNEIERGN